MGCKAEAKALQSYQLRVYTFDVGRAHEWPAQRGMASSPLMHSN